MDQFSGSIPAASACGGTFGGRVKIWDLTSPADDITIVSSSSRMALSPDGRWVAGISHSQAGRKITIWEAQTGLAARHLSVKHDVGDLAFSGDGKLLAAAAWREKSEENPAHALVELWDTASAEQKGVVKPRGWINDLKFSPNGKELVTATRDTIEIWDVASAGRLASIDAKQTWVYEVAYSPDGKRLASAGGDATVCVWDLETKAESLRLKRVKYTGPANCVAFSPDGKRLVSGFGDRTPQVWDAEDGKELVRLTGHGNSLHALAYSPDGKRIASGSLDRTLKLWDAETGDEIFTWKDHAQPVMSVAFSRDGRRIASISRNGLIKVYDATPLPAKP